MAGFLSPASQYNKRRDLAQAQQRKASNFELWKDLSVGVVFSVGGSIYAPHSNGQRVWVHEYGSPNSQAQAILGGAIVQEGSPVKLMRYPKDPMLWQIVDLYLGGINPSVTQPIEPSSVSLHGTNHQMPTEASAGIDPVLIWPAAMQMLKTTGDGATLSVLTKGLVYYNDDAEVIFPGAITDMTADLPGANLKRTVLLYLDPATNTIVKAQSSTVADIPENPLPTPSVQPDTFPSALIILTNGQTSINTINHVRDRRTFNQRYGAVSSWLDLTDTDPSTFAAQAGLLVRVNAAPDGLEFVDHEDLVAVHVAHNYTYADAAARTGAGGFAADDIGKIAHQEDDDSFWVLQETTPTWAELTGSGGSTTWLALTDTDPASYAGQAGRFVRVNATPDGLEFVDAPSGAATWLDLTDTDPATYAGQAGKYVRVNATPDGLEFITPPPLGDVSGPGSSTDHAVARWDGATGDTLQDSTAIINDDGSTELTIADAGTSGPVAALEVGHNTSGSPNPNFGTQILFKAETTTTPDTAMGFLDFIWQIATHASRRAAISLGFYNVANRFEVMRIEPSNDAGSTAGGTRGLGSIEMQVHRAATTEIASGDFSSIFGGDQNTADGDYSTVVGGLQNETQLSYSAILAGNGNLNRGGNAVILGGTNNTIDFGKQACLIAAAQSATVEQNYGIALGSNALSYLEGMMAHCNGLFATELAETIRVNLRLAQASHTDTTWYELFLNGTDERLEVPVDYVLTVKILITGATSGLAETWHYEVNGMVKNAGGTTTIVEGTNEVIHEDDAAYEVRLLADDTNDALLIQVRRNGGSDFSIRWHAAVTASLVEFT